MNEWGLRPICDLLKAQFAGEWGADASEPGELVRVFRAADFTRAGIIEGTGGVQRRITGAKLKRIELRPGDLLLEKSGGSPDQPVGRVRYFEGAAEKAVASNFLQTLRPSDAVDSKFLFYLLQAEYSRGRVLPFQQQTTGIINLRLTDYLNEQVLIPTRLEEQQRIATLLSAVDREIETLDETANKEESRFSALLQRLMPEGFSLECKPNEHFGNALVGIEGGKSFTCSDVPASPGAWGVLKVSAIRPDGFVAAENKLVENLALVNPRYEVKEGDLLITRANTPELVGAACFVRSTPRGLLLCDKTLRLQPKLSALPQYLWLWLQTPVARRHVDAHATGTSAGMKNISQASINKIPLMLPSPEEQQRRVAPIVALLDYVALLRNEAGKLRLRKAGLMHKLLIAPTAEGCA